MKVIATEKAPGAIGPYSQGFLTNGFVYTSGQIPVNPADGTIPEGIAAQAEQSCKNVGAILEAGGKDNWIWFHVPVGYLYAIGNPRADWMFRTEPQPGLNGRAIAYPRGKVIGGCSAINAMIYMRGQAADYDGWRQRGLSGWGWDEVLPFFLRHEDHVAPPPGGLH